MTAPGRGTPPGSPSLVGEEYSKVLAALLSAASAKSGTQMSFLDKPDMQEIVSTASETDELSAQGAQGRTYH